MLKKQKKKTKKKRKAKAKKISYEDIEEIVEYLVKTKSYKYKFDCYEPNDISQEIRIICIKALDHFDVNRVDEGQWKNFFGRCVDNALKNLKRDNYLRTSPPCKSNCPDLHGEEFIEQFKGFICKRWLKFYNGLKKKISIMHPLNIDVMGHNILDRDFEKEIETEDFKAEMRDFLPRNLKNAFDLMTNGKSSKVPARDKKKIRKILREFLD